MTWGDIKRIIESEGITDDAELDYIDISRGGYGGAEDMCVAIDEFGFAVHN